MDRVPAILIALLSATTAFVVAMLAAPGKRAVAIAVVSIPFAIGAVVAARSALRERPFQGDTKVETIGGIVGDGRTFIEQAPELARQFDSWLHKRGLSASSPTELLELVWRHAGEIHQQRELLLAAVAAYGEAVRRESGGSWFVSRTLVDGEPIIARRYQPWSRRRVLLEVLEILSSSTPVEFL